YRITINGVIKNVDLDEDDVILYKHPKDQEDYDYFSKSQVLSGTRLIKHDLSLIGFDFDDVDYPFYLIQFPLRRMRTAGQWASKVMGRDLRSLQYLWHELLYYGYEKGYEKPEVKTFDRILRLRV